MSLPDPSPLGRLVRNTHREKSGPGVTGRLTHLGLGAIAALVALGFNFSDDASRLMFGAVVFLLVLMLGGAILWFGAKYPGAAVTEGSDYSRTREIELAAMNREVVIASTPIPAPPPTLDGPKNAE